MAKFKKWAKKIALVLSGVGAINWGLVSVAGFNLVETVFGMSTAAKWVYALIGISGIFALYSVFTGKK